MEKNNLNGEYDLLVHSIDGTVWVYRLDKQKFRLFTFGRGNTQSRHLSVKLKPDDPNKKGQHFLSSMQCYFAWDRERNDWVVGNGKPPDIYVPMEARKHFTGVSSGPDLEINRVHYCPNLTEDQHGSSRALIPLTGLLGCRGVPAVAFLSCKAVSYKASPSEGHQGMLLKRHIPFACLIEISPVSDNNTD